jgi:hypothetical protein
MDFIRYKLFKSIDQNAVWNIQTRIFPKLCSPQNNLVIHKVTFLFFNRHLFGKEKSQCIVNVTHVAYIKNLVYQSIPNENHPNL